MRTSALRNNIRETPTANCTSLKFAWRQVTRFKWTWGESKFKRSKSHGSPFQFHALALHPQTATNSKIDSICLRSEKSQHVSTFRNGWSEAISLLTSIFGTTARSKFKVDDCKQHKQAVCVNRQRLKVLLKISSQRLIAITILWR